jgi:hypothetical protein
MNPSQNATLFSPSEHVELRVTTNKGSYHKLHHLSQLIIQTSGVTEKLCISPYIKLEFSSA